MGNLKNGFEEQNSTSEPSLSLSSSECKKAPLSSGHEENSLTPPSLNFSYPKFDVDGDVEIQSPGNNYSNWETYFAEQLEVDFMNLSPVRDISSPQKRTTNLINSNDNNNNHNYNSPQPMQWHSLVGGVVCSPPRMYSPLGPYGSSSSNKGKGISPLHKIFSSPDNQFMNIESLSLPALESLLDDNNTYEKDEDFSNYPALKQSDVGYSSEIFENLNVPELLDYFTMENSSRFGDSEANTSSIQGSLHATPGSDGYQMPTPPVHAPLSQQLLRERMQEKQQEHQEMNQHTQITQQQMQNINHTLMMPLNIAPEQEQDSGLQLVHLLLACAEAVAKEDYMLARRYLHHLNRVVTPLGDSMQRVAACFTDALSARLAATLTRKSSSSSISSSSSSSSKSPFIVPSPSNSPEVLKIYQILYQACPYIKFAHFTANQAIFEAFEAEERVHVIDLDILQGYQWPAFMQALAARPGGPPFLRITGVGPNSDSVRETGRCLTELANSLHVPFEFHPVGEQLEDLKPHMFNRRVGEALAVNSVNRLHRVPGNSLGNLLAMIRDQAPNIVTIVEQEASHNGPYFLGRFLEALHYYSAIFDSLDATFPADSAQRAKVEQYIFAPDIRNIVSCEGPERIVRHERLEKWRKIMEGKGFKSVQLSSNAVTQSRILLNLYSCDGYRLTEDKGCLLLGWQDRAVLAASAWRC
ncbi:hypothetical protein Leryth_004204 [Lithospermum erythrorhizon]|uniref:Uncharacterized protein n=1 Tax=Lithospermum erythrorhizon TaxID=34254 RepID=A0AAV3PHU8_LITER|nr:hypothetical protein Leryth_004204 [Lithospermum erythrorhizon]